MVIQSVSHQVDVDRLYLMGWIYGSGSLLSIAIIERSSSKD